MDPTTTLFWQTALRSGLLTETQLRTCWDLIPEAKRTASAIDQRLARRALSQRWVTIWQAQNLLQGRVKGYFLDRYRILSRLGSGGMGHVYLALDSRLVRYVSVKMLSTERQSNPRALKRFQREVKLGAQLQHENLVRIYDGGEIRGAPYLVMEYIDGFSLAELIPDDRGLSPGEATEYVRQIALGLDYLERMRFLHRDINPTNILVDRRGMAKLTDLGLAISLDDREGQITRDGAIVGTFDYISPEQTRNARKLDVRSDIYSLGCTLYHTLCGEPPFTQPSLPEKLFAHQALDPEPLTKRAPEIPEALDQIVLRMLAKKPEARYQTPREVIDALTPFAEMPDRTERPIMPGRPKPHSDSLETFLYGKQEPASTGSTTSGLPSNAVSPQTEGASGLVAIPIKPSTPNDSLDEQPTFPVIKIDQADLPSASRSADALSFTDDRDPTRWTLWVGGILLGVLLILAVWILLESDPLLRGIGIPDPPRTRDSEEVEDRGRGDEPTALFQIQRPNDRDLQSVATLRDALIQLGSKSGQIMIRCDETITLCAGDLPVIEYGKIVLKGDPSKRVRLVVKVDGQTPWLSVRAGGSVCLADLEIVVVSDSGVSGTEPLIRFEGEELELVASEITTLEGSPPLTVPLITHSGGSLSLKETRVDGFLTPLVIDAYARTTVDLSNCLLQGSGRPDHEGIRITRRNLNSQGNPRALTLRQTSVRDFETLIHAEAFNESLPLGLTIETSHIQTDRLIRWKSEAKPDPQSLSLHVTNNALQFGSSDWLVDEQGQAYPRSDIDIVSQLVATSANLDSLGAGVVPRLLGPRAGRIE